MKLNELKDNPGAKRPRKRLGRGIGSGLGKTGGRGGKGQTARSGVAVRGFEGGQMPIYRRLPKRGFNKPFQSVWNEVNLGRLQAAFDKGILDASAPVDIEALLKSGVVSRRLDGVRILAKGEIKIKASFVVDHASKAAVAAIEKAGGSVTLTKPAEAEAAE